MSKKRMTLADLLEPFRDKYFISGEINTRVSDMATVQSRLKDLQLKYHDAHTYMLDGFSAEFDDWHFNVRASNTEPMLRLNLEATTPALMAQRRDEVLRVIRT
jgi:phosphomannomutase